MTDDPTADLPERLQRVYNAVVDYDGGPGNVFDIGAVLDIDDDQEVVRMLVELESLGLVRLDFDIRASVVRPPADKAVT